MNESPLGSFSNLCYSVLGMCSPHSVGSVEATNERSSRL